MSTELESFFAGGATSAKFEDKAYGTVIGGEIVADPIMQQQRDYETGDPIAYPDGNPAMQLVVTVQAQPAGGDDDGRRSFYVKGQLKQAVGEALRKAGASAPRKGGELYVKYIEDKPVTLKNGRPGNPQKIYAAKYTPPAPVDGGQFFASDKAVPAPPPGVDPAQWAAMTDGQRAQFAALTQTVQAADAARASAFNDEPPF